MSGAQTSASTPTRAAGTPRFGVITFSSHRPDCDTTLQLEQDVALAQQAERLGFAECWWVEQHSGGTQVVADPFTMVAHAAANTGRIGLGALSSLELHQPKLLLDNAIQLTHLTRGRFRWALGTLSSPHDRAMLGIDHTTGRRLLSQALTGIEKLLDGQTAVIHDSGGPEWSLRQARLGVAPYPAEWPLQVAAFGSPDTPRLAARAGLGMLSFASTMHDENAQDNPMVLAWQRATMAAARRDGAANRDNWSVISPIHIAATEAEARQQVQERIVGYFDAVGHLLPFSLPTRPDADALIDAIHAAGHGVIGTPQMAIKHIEQVLQISGGVGTFLVEAGAWAHASDTHASLALFAEQVAPKVRGLHRVRLAAAERVHSHVPAAPAPQSRPEQPTPPPARRPAEPRALEERVSQMRQSLQQRRAQQARAAELAAGSLADQRPTDPGNGGRPNPPAPSQLRPRPAPAVERPQPAPPVERPQPTPPVERPAPRLEQPAPPTAYRSARPIPSPIPQQSGPPTPPLHHSVNGSARRRRTGATGHLQPSTPSRGIEIPSSPPTSPPPPAEAPLRRRGRHAMGSDDGNRNNGR
ncbi:MAG: LLM class flavin-dependent oxidoreductase [Beutenbergiaceae bacterium]